jgi:outer membrane murein-binding lipoprotein Lpp
MRRTLAWVVVAVVLIAGCGGGSDRSKSGGGGSGGSDSSSASAGDRQYIDPFQSSAGGVVCLSKRQVQQKIDRIASRVQNPERKQRAIQAVRDRPAC